jgi:hypothetical protein
MVTNYLDVCCLDTIRFRNDLPTQGDVIPCGSCPNALRYSAGEWYVVPFPTIAATEARHEAAKDAGVDLQPLIDASPYQPKPSRYCSKCARIATHVGSTDHNDTYACPERHITMIQKGAA